MNTKRGYLASVLLAGVMIAGYLGMLPLLQSLAAEPAWPAAVSAASSSTQVVTTEAAPGLKPTPVLASSRPAMDKKTAKKSAKATRTGPPARSSVSGGSTSNANEGPSSGPSKDFGGSDHSGLAAGGGGDEQCVGVLC